MAEQHYQLQLKRKVWAAWHSLISTRWKERVERACRARAEEVCVQLSNDYEAKVAQVRPTPCAEALKQWIAFFFFTVLYKIQLSL